MHRYAMRALASCVLAASSWGTAAWAYDSDVQKTDPEKCQEDDPACAQDWYKEYSGAILAEFKYYSHQEDFLAEMLANRQEPLITARLSLLLIEGGVKYGQWAVLKDEAVAAAARLDMARYHAIIGACRDAASGMRTALFDLRQHPDNVRGEAAQYVKDAMACERAFALTPVASKLRSQGRPARAPARAPAAPAPSNDAAPAPMDITPPAQHP